MLDTVFATELATAWFRESEKVNFSEVQQFRALMRSFAALPPPFRVEEFHGMKHQVTFNGEGIWGRQPARCEISDLLIVTFRTIPDFDARVTLLQAKRSIKKHTGLCSYWPSNSAPTTFKANLEQWDLLSRRPYVLPYKPFDCHPEILHGALLPSIGSIGVFHRVKGKRYDFFYMSADTAFPVGNPRQKYAKLETRKGPNSRTTDGYFERLFACCITTFALSLYNLEIGTPIQDESGLASEDGSYRNMLRGWLRGVLYGHIEAAGTDATLARELADQLQSDYEQPFMSEPPSVLIVNSDTDEIDDRRR